MTLLHGGEVIYTNVIRFITNKRFCCNEKSYFSVILWHKRRERGEMKNLPKEILLAPLRRQLGGRGLETAQEEYP